MGAREELERHIVQAAQVERGELLLPGSPLFHQKTAKVVTGILEWEMGPSPGFWAACRETVKSLLPLVDFLTQTRSIAGFQALKRGLLELIHDYHQRTGFFAGEDLIGAERAGRANIVEWLEYLLPELGIFRNWVELDSLEEESVDEIWQKFEKLEPRAPRKSEEKIVSLTEAGGFVKEWRKEWEGQVGYAVGKWRGGPHLDISSCLNQQERF